MINHARRARARRRRLELERLQPRDLGHALAATSFGSSRATAIK